MEHTYFQWPDYLVLGVMLSLSAAIGFYYACSGGKQKTTKEYLLADRNMHWFPVACSLLASFTSSITLLGLPGEIYTFGTIFLMGFIFKPIGLMIGVSVFIPIFRQIGCVSVYKYIELRYGKKLKSVLMVKGVLSMLLYTALVIYGPALSISVVTGVNIWLAVFSVVTVAMLYTVLGGLKAVLWTDTLQLMIMLAGVVLLLIAGVIHEGGFGEIWNVNKLSGRLDILEPEKFLIFDPRMRHTLWGLAIMSILGHGGVYGYSQISVQRALSLRSGRDVILAYGFTAAGTMLFGVLCGFMGLMIFSYFQLCDPIKYGVIWSKDQLYPLYVMRLLGHLPGLPGLILSSVMSASLSTVSSSLNSGSTIILQDIVRPFKPNLTEKHATIISKITSVLLGATSLILVLFAKHFGNGLLSMGLTFFGVFGGPSLAVYTMGILLPIINERGALVGFICGSLYASWIGFGGLIHRPYIYRYPTTDVGCNITDINILANLSSPVYDPSTWNPQSHYRSGVTGLYDISYIWASAGGTLVTLLFSIIFSLILAREDDEKIDQKLLSPLVFKSCCYLPKSWRDRIRVSGSEEKIHDEKIDLSDVTDEFFQNGLTKKY